MKEFLVIKTINVSCKIKANDEYEAKEKAKNLPNEEWDDCGVEDYEVTESEDSNG